MQISLKLKRNIFTFPKILDFFDILLFAFFFTLHADRLSFSLGATTLRFNNLIAFALIIMLSLRLRKSAFTIPNRLGWAWLLLSISILLSTLFSIDHFRSSLFLIWYGVTALCYFFLPFFLFLSFDEKRILKPYFIAFLLVGLYGGLQLFLSFFGIIDPSVGQLFGGGLARPNAFSYEPSYLTLYMTPFMVLVNGHFIINREGPFFGFQKIGWRELIFLNLLYFITLTTSTLLGFLLFLAFLMTGPFRKNFPSYRKSLKKAFVLFFLLCALFSLCFPALSKELLFKFFYQGIFHHSFYERWIGIVNSMQLFFRHPFFGVGLGNVPIALFEAWREREAGFIFFLQEELLFQAPNPLKYFEPSNVLSEILASLGSFGTLAFIFLFMTYFREVKSALSRPLSIQKKEEIFLFFLSTVVMLLLLQLSQGLFRTYIWTHFALSYAMTVKKT